MTAVPLYRAALLALALVVAPFAVQAQGPQCGPGDTLLRALAEGYLERPVGRGMTFSGALFEVLAGHAGTWSVLVTVAGGQTCLVSSGEGWRRPPPRFPDRSGGLQGATHDHCNHFGQEPLFR